MISQIASKISRPLNGRRRVVYYSTPAPSEWQLLNPTVPHQKSNNKFTSSSNISSRLTQSKLLQGEVNHVLSAAQVDSLFSSLSATTPSISNAVTSKVKEKPTSKSPKTLSSCEISIKDQVIKKSNDGETVFNVCGIQMLPRSLHRQIFKSQHSSAENQLSPATLTKIKDHLTEHNLWGRPTSTLPNIEFQLPSLLGKNLPEHFEKIAKKQCKSYVENLLQLITHPVPDIPPVWNFAPGWTRYSENGEIIAVDFPDENAYVFDVEVCVLEGHAPTLATAVSNSYWYSWCSHQLFEQKVYKYKLHVKVVNSKIKFLIYFIFLQVGGPIMTGLNRNYGLRDLINLETKPGQDRLAMRDQKERLVIGHNVSYDRARVKEQYFVEGIN